MALATLAGSVQFLLVTNFPCWVLHCPQTWSGLGACYVAALPFFRNTLLGDAVFCGLLFGGLALAERGFPRLRERSRPIPNGHASGAWGGAWCLTGLVRLLGLTTRAGADSMEGITILHYVISLSPQAAKTHWEPPIRAHRIDFPQLRIAFVDFPLPAGSGLGP